MAPQLSWGLNLQWSYEMGPQLVVGCLTAELGLPYGKAIGCFLGLATELGGVSQQS
jgi:hypothetical protein